MDGHSGISNESRRTFDSEFFSLVLSYLKDAQGNAFFIVHIQNKKSYSFGLQPKQFLEDIGLAKFKGNCTFHQYDCYYHVIAQSHSREGESPDYQQIDAIHNNFGAFAKKIDHLFTLCREENLILENISLSKDSTFKFGPIIEIDTQISLMPPWVNEYKPQELLYLEERKKEIDSDIDFLHGYLPLLYGSGEILEDATLKALNCLGLNARKTEQGFTADILATTTDGMKRFGFEVTGINGPIKKENRKLTQVLDFERIKENEEKTVLIANTYNNIPISEREAKESFTKPVLDFLGGHNILLMTSYQLYKMVIDVMEGRKTSEEILVILSENRGQLSY